MVRAVGTTLGYVVTGYLEQEWILPIDTELTAIGTVRRLALTYALHLLPLYTPFEAFQI